MSAESSMSPGPAFTQVKLTGPPAEVDRLMAVLSASAEIISDSQSDPDARGEVERVAHLVTHPDPRPVPAEGGMSVTVQSTLEAEGGVFRGLPGEAAAQEVERAVATALAGLPDVRQASSRVVSLCPCG
ncbi:hypothetical protein SUDANB105_07978 [Streptomyces sp. enrichment culture]|uniref:hypothetical protein n=1 Tax=Streptomyces sp. enrichment culture TaxID=1795815 RepID=UPI003F54D8AA